MKIILLSGGYGKRLWPLTSSKRAKQYLPMLDSPGGAAESLLQRVWRQLGDAGLQTHTHISTCLEQMEIVQRQTGGQAGIVVEPEPRDTYPAVALAAAYLHSIAGVSLNETIVVMPVDAFVEADFYESLHELPVLLQQSGHEWLAFTSASSRDQRAATGVNARTGRVDADGPDFARNSSVYAFQLGTMITMITRQGLPAYYDELYKQYGRLAKVGLESELQHRMAAKGIVHYHGNWTSLRSWRAMAEKIRFARLGAGEGDKGGEQTTIMNELGIPITIVGLDQLLVAAGPNGILIAAKAAEAQLDAALKALIAPSCCEEYNWGSVRVIDRGALSSGLQSVTNRIKITAGHNMNYEMHFHRSEVWTVLAGDGIAIVDERSFRIGAGDTIRIPERSRHSVLAITELELLEVQTGQTIREDDCIRLGSAWEEITGQMNMA